jgi:phosphoribosyl 1,2-cyclic phosphodiesterase
MDVDNRMASCTLSLHVLSSGSCGNAALVDYQGHLLAIDCGICKREYLRRCADLHIDPCAIQAILITHDHSDHTKGLGVLARGLAKQGCHSAVYVSDTVRDASPRVQELERICDVHPMSAGSSLSLAGMQVMPFHTSHDAAESFGFRIEAPNASDSCAQNDVLGFMTDTGIVPDAAHEALKGSRILGIESNHDVTMLATGEYPASLKRRIRSDYGHLSNDECATEVSRLLNDSLEQIVALHISEHNNTFGMPVRVLESMLAHNGHHAHVQAGLPRTPISVS